MVWAYYDINGKWEIETQMNKRDLVVDDVQTNSVGVGNALQALCGGLLKPKVHMAALLGAAAPWSRCGGQRLGQGTQVTCAQASSARKGGG